MWIFIRLFHTYVNLLRKAGMFNSQGITKVTVPQAHMLSDDRPPLGKNMCWWRWPVPFSRNGGQIIFPHRHPQSTSYMGSQLFHLDWREIKLESKWRLKCVNLNIWNVLRHAKTWIQTFLIKFNKSMLSIFIKALPMRILYIKTCLICIFFIIISKAS